MAKSTISLSFKVVDGENGLKNLEMSSANLQKFLKGAVTEAEYLKKKIIDFAVIATGIDSVSNSLSTIHGVVKNVTAAYGAQIEAETQLAVNMRNSMGAREEEIQSIKDLCSAQQELGIIGDEVQLAGAQELATYLSQKQSLETLIPVMNDMVAQQGMEKFLLKNLVHSQKCSTFASL